MSTLTNIQQWELALIDSDAQKADRLRSLIDSTVHYFSNFTSLYNYLRTTNNAQECLLLAISATLAKNLPPDINEVVRGIFIYGETNQNKFQTFNDVCLHLCSLRAAQCTMQSIYYHRSNENGLAQLRARESIAQTKILIGQLQDLCDEIDENISLGQEATG